MMDSKSPQIIRGACGHDCPDTCTWLVEVQQGVAKRLYGDPGHPFTRGTLCAKVNHYLERVYHPDRLLFPLKRVGDKGDGRFVRVGWPDALAEIAGRWETIIEESGAEAILPFSFAGNQGLIQYASLDRRLFGLIGASQLTRGLCGDVATAGVASTQGADPFDPEEIVHSRFIVLWGTNTIVTNLHLWPLIREARERGARVVVVDPVRTRTAEAADWHISPIPGTDAALALGMMNVIVRENLVDHDYVSRYALGFEKLAERVAKDYPPQRCEQITGVPAAEIERFARAYASTQPSLIRPLIGLEHHQNGAMMFRTIACLPVMTGAWRHRGGGLARSTHAFQHSVLNVDALRMPEVQRPARTLNMRDLGNDLCSMVLHPPIRSLLVYNCNPAVILPNQNRVIEGLRREDLFTIVHDLFITETARFADFVLPATSQIEHLDLVPAWGHHYISLNRPAIEPRGESVSNTELFRRLASALHRSEPWLFDSDEKLLQDALASRHPFLDGITWEYLWKHGYARLRHATDWKPFADGGFATPSGKAELFSKTLEEQGHDPLPIHNQCSAPGRYPLQLITGKALHLLNSSYSHIERLRKCEGELFVELNPEDARSRGLTNGQPVLVFNDVGKVTAACRVSARVRPGLAWMPHGLLTDLQRAHRSVNALTSEVPTDWGGGSGFYDAFVDISGLPDG